MNIQFPYKGSLKNRKGFKDTSQYDINRSFFHEQIKVNAIPIFFFHVKQRPSLFFLSRRLGDCFDQSFGDFPEPKKIHRRQDRSNRNKAVKPQWKHLLHLQKKSNFFRFTSLKKVHVYFAQSSALKSPDGNGSTCVQRSR